MLPISIPETHHDLFDGSAYVALTTMMPDGQPQTTPVWCNTEGDYLFINTMRGFQKEKNLRLNPSVTVLIYDPRNPMHNIEIRGKVLEITETGALDHLDQLARLYMHKPDAKFFGDSIPVERMNTHIPVKIKIAPLRVRAEG